MSSFSDPVEFSLGPQVVVDSLRIGYGKKHGARVALDGFSAIFPPGITGLVGPNGAGKTTFLRAACGLLRPFSGTLEIEGRTAIDYVTSKGVGFLPEDPPLPRFLTVGEFLRGIPPFGTEIDGPEMEARWILRVKDLLEEPLDTLSLGQRKKVALAAALKGQPLFLLLDEPTNGLDPTAVKELRQTLLEERERGITTIVSSHHLDELQRLADRLVFVKEGRVAGSWTREEALEGFPSLEALFDHILERREG